MDSFDPPVEFEKGLLHRILRVLAIAKNVIRDALEPPAMLQVDLFERSNLAPAARRQKFGLAQKFPGLRLANQRFLRFRFPVLGRTAGHDRWKLSAAPCSILPL